MKQILIIERFSVHHPVRIETCPDLAVCQVRSLHARCAPARSIAESRVRPSLSFTASFPLLAHVLARTFVASTPSKLLSR
jgi:hypothetical protein